MVTVTEALFGAPLWGPALEKYGAVTHLTVALYGRDGRLIGAPVPQTPLGLHRNQRRLPCLHRGLGLGHGVSIRQRHVRLQSESRGVGGWQAALQRRHQFHERLRRRQALVVEHVGQP